MPTSPDQEQKLPYRITVFDENVVRCRANLNCIPYSDRVELTYSGTPLLKFVSEDKGVEVAYGDLPTETTFHLGLRTAISVFSFMGDPIALISGDMVDQELRR